MVDVDERMATIWDNLSRFVENAMENELLIANTFYPKKDKYKWTYREKRGVRQ